MAEKKYTGRECPEHGNYRCALHRDYVTMIDKGDQFPACNNNGVQHSTRWKKVSKK